MNLCDPLPPGTPPGPVEGTHSCAGCGQPIPLVAREGIATAQLGEHDCPLRCVKCGHPPCPGCGDWCDKLIPDGDGDWDLCCDGECTFAVKS